MTYGVATVSRIEEIMGRLIINISRTQKSSRTQSSIYHELKSHLELNKLSKNYQLKHCIHHLYEMHNVIMQCDVMCCSVLQFYITRTQYLI